MKNTLPAKRKARGRPTKFVPALRRRLVEVIAAGVPLRHACAACRISYASFCEYRNDNPAFQEAIEQATAAAIEKHLRLIITAAEKGSTADSRWFLERVHSQHFGRTKIEVSGPDGAPLAGAIAVYLPRKDSDAPAVSITQTKAIEA